MISENLKTEVVMAALWLSLACTVLLEPCASSPAKTRHARSFWPFETTTESVLSEKHLQLLEKAGYGKNFNLSMHPMWKVHTYEGISLKPVHVETEIIEPSQLDARNVPAIPERIAPIDEEAGNSTETPDFSFFDDLGGYADWLPTPSEDEDFSKVDEIVVEEEPGFFKRIWLKIWGLPKTSKIPIEAAELPPEAEVKKASKLGFLSSIFNFGSSDEKQESEKEDDSVTIYLPETQGPYVAVVVPSDESAAVSATAEAAVQDPHSPASFASQAEETQAATSKPLETLALPDAHANQFGEAVVEQAPVSIPKPVQLKPVAQWPQAPTGGLAKSRSWVQSWSPAASYEVRVEELTPTDGAQQRVPIVETAAQFQRKSLEVDEKSANEGRPEEDASVDGEATKEPKSERARDALSNLDVPEGLMKRLQVSDADVSAALNSSESKARSRERLRSLQEDFEKKKQQLSYLYSRRPKLQEKN